MGKDRKRGLHKADTRTPIARGLNERICSGKVQFSDGDSAGTEKSLEIDLPGFLRGDNIYQLLVGRDKLDIEIEISAYVVWEDVEDNERESELFSFTVEENMEVSKLMQGLMMGDKAILKVEIQDDLTEDMTVYLQVRAL